MRGKMIIESIQRTYCLHPEDVAARERNGDGKEIKHNEETIRQLQEKLVLSSSMIIQPHFIESRPEPGALHSWN